MSLTIFKASSLNLSVFFLLPAARHSDTSEMKKERLGDLESIRALAAFGTKIVVPASKPSLSISVKYLIVSSNLLFVTFKD